MMTLNEIRSELADRNLAEVARRVGMTRQQLWLIVNGINTNPTLRTLERLSDYLSGKDGAP